MGDRACAVIKDGEDNQVYLYTHWAGSELPEVLRAALLAAKAENRLDDGPYLARIIFCHMIAQDAEPLYGCTGYGISAQPVDGRDLFVDVTTQTVHSRDFNIPLTTIEDFIHGNYEAEDEDDEAEGDD